LVSQLRETCCYAHHTFLLGFPTGCYTALSSIFLAQLPGRKKISARGASHAQSFTLLLFGLLYFFLHRFIKNTKKLVPSIVVIFVGLLLSLFIMLSINGWFI
jgi:hypothetical protein